MLGVAILGVAAVAASGRLGELPPAVSSTPLPHLPQGDLTAGELRSTRFSVVARGYSMPQVDDLLERLARQLEGEPRPAAAALPDAQLPSPAADVATRSPGEAAETPGSPPRAE